MAGAYAAVVSLVHTIEQIQHHPHPPISLEQKQVDPLMNNLTFLQDFLEGYSHVIGSRADGLESRIADAAYAAEDIIESYMVDRIRSRSTAMGKIISLISQVQKVIEDMDFIKKEAMQFKEKMGIQDQLQGNSSTSSAGSKRSASTGQNSTLVGFDCVRKQVMDQLFGHQSNLQIIPIVGMGGIGKTTLARNIYEQQIVIEHFDIRSWVTVSQEYRIREILSKVLQEEDENLSKHDLQEKLHKRLLGRRYLIIMDDIWDIEVWDQLRRFFPENKNRSRIMLTTRLSNLASQIADCHGIKMGFLDEENSWNLFCKNVFGKDDSPSEIEDIGKKIARNCKGLPLSITVIGGLLAKCEQTRQHWEYIAENLNSIVNLENDEHCFQILYMSYKSLSVYLKPCFLYMGIFPEDSEISAFELINLWVAEGFLKSIAGKSLEEAGDVYLKELIDRNLILVKECNDYEETRSCIIHDLLRDLCLREAETEKFICVLREKSDYIPHDMSTRRRICIRKSTKWKECPSQVRRALESDPLARSLIWEFQESSPSFSSTLLRVSSTVDKTHDHVEETDSLEPVFQQVNLRYLSIQVRLNSFTGISSSISLLWNLQTLVIYNGILKYVFAPSEIWKLPQLRHVQFNKFQLQLPDPPSGHTDGRDGIVLENLQTLLLIYNLKCCEDLVRRIPNIKRLGICYERFRLGCLNNIGHLRKLESLSLKVYQEGYFPNHLAKNLTLPGSLKQLTLEGTYLHWEELTSKIGSLPLLQSLKLKRDSCRGPEWNTAKGWFCSLKFLLIEARDLKYWKTESTHFPRLERLELRYLNELEMIPSAIGEITTLQSIHLGYCSDSAIISAKRIQEEQEELGNVDFKVQVFKYGYKRR